MFILVCHAIQHAHQKGIIHRDIKPSNILVTLHDGVPVPKVIAFGIAKATQQELTDKTVFTHFQQFIGTPAYNGTNLVGWWRPTPSYLPGPPLSGASMAAPWLADVTPFVVLSGDQFVAPPPPPLGSGLYRKEYDEVKALGALVGSSRTPAQTQIAYFWADNFPAQVNRLLRSLSETHLDNSADRARLFALVWLAASDSIIKTWTGKLEYPTWRPITAINEGDFDGDPKTIGDVNWQPLINTPNYPDHSSGANAFISGVMKMLALYFGTDNVTFTVTSNNPNEWMRMEMPSITTRVRFLSPASLRIRGLQISAAEVPTYGSDITVQSKAGRRSTLTETMPIVVEPAA